MLQRVWADFLRIFYPEVCAACDRSLVRGEEALCTHCVNALPRTRAGFDLQNPTARIFYGRVPVAAAGSFLIFRPGGMVRDMLHQIKYRGKRQLAVVLGRMYGEELQQGGIQPPDFIIPVPLHPRKERQRGYNQSACFAEGLAERIGGTIETGLLVRRRFTQTQTRRSRWARWENVNEVFGVTRPAKLAGKHILLVDDVVTTGATLEACAAGLLGAGAASVSVLTIAVAAR